MERGASHPHIKDDGRVPENRDARSDQDLAGPGGKLQSKLECRKTDLPRTSHGRRFKLIVKVPLLTIEPITPQNAFLFKTLRLCALEDAPHAFSATYARESEFADAEWLERVERMNGQKGAGFLAMDGDQACGIVGSFLDSNDRTRAELVSMWTAPTHRHRGIGRRLVNEVIRWAHLRGAQLLLLMVTSNNEPAMRFYERMGFTPTGRTEPYPNDPAVIEYEMSRPILAAPDS